ncbi:MAG: lytic transglycosylase domain-containing protein [Myxococcota bacterium]|nr:lytic transglycosylase domain-containing protein [Myxococcota bacterium]
MLGRLIGPLRAKFVMVAVAFSLGAALSHAGQPLYRYTGPDGTVHFTNVPNDRKFHRVFLTAHGLVREGARIMGSRPIPANRGYDRLIERAASAYDVAPALVKAVIAAESDFDPTATSHKGAQGLMQLMPETALGLGVSDPYSPRDNVLGGTRYLRELLDRYGDMSRALAAYNAGPRAVDRYRGVPPYRETQQYVSRVLHYYRGYHRDFAQR